MYQFLESNIPDNIIDEFVPTKFSTEAQTMFQIMFRHMKSGLQALERHKVTVTPIVFQNQSTFPHGHNFDYCPEKVQHHIGKMKKKGSQFTLQLYGHTINIHIICSSKKENYDSFIQDAIKRIYIWLHLAFQYSRPKCSKTMNVYLYMTNLQKTLPRIGEPIREFNANTAFTTSCQPSTEMHLFREEEWFKVFIHETFHSLGLDFSEFDHRKTNKEILSIFPVNSDVRLFETYCEMWAEIIHCMFIAFYENQNGEPTVLIERTQELLDRERVFSLFQCAKILHFYGLDYIDLYERTQKSHLIRLSKYKEETHVLSYYIIKSILMFFVNDYVKWVAILNANSLNFDKTPEKLQQNLMEYCTFIQTHYNKREYTNVLHSIDTWISNNQNSHPIFGTLRMTVNDM
uniref:Uncharacterized protein n=1 Tax=viral metagenome TaxID=1070528 RepID=A0A6C0D6C4_9ZZZZ